MDTGYEFLKLKPLLVELHRQLDLHLIATFLDTVLVILCYRNRNHGPLSGEYAQKARVLIPPENWYDLACLESVCGNADLGIEHLRRAAEDEALDRDWARQDPEFYWIRDDHRFLEIVASPQ